MELLLPYVILDIFSRYVVGWPPRKAPVAKVLSPY